MEKNIDTKTANLMKAIAYAENGGKPTMPQTGKTGEMKSIFQYTPDTWKMYSKQASGEDLPMNVENETAVTYAKINKWLEDGFTPEQVSSMWNAGEQRPDAYKQNWKGMNKKYGVPFDTPAYTSKVMNYFKEFMGGKTEKPIKRDVKGVPKSNGSPGMMNQQPNEPQNKTEGLLLGQMKESKMKEVQMKQPREI